MSTMTGGIFGSTTNPMFGTVEKGACANVNCLAGSPVQNADGTCGCSTSPIGLGILPKYPTGTIINPVTGQVTSLGGGNTIMSWFSAHPYLSLGGAALAIWLLLKMFSKR